jgi:hypothetical protein
MKRLLLVLGAIAMVACFSAVGHGMTLSDSAQIDQRELVRLVIALGIPFAVGLTRGGRFKIADSSIVLASNAFALFTLSPWLVDLLRHGPGGARVLVIVTAAGLALATFGLVQALRTHPKSQAVAESAPPL